MNKQQFSDLAKQGYTHIPVFREVAADLDTPLSAYLKLANSPNSFLFESVQGGERWGRYSIIGLQCDESLQVRGEQIEVFQRGQCVEKAQDSDPLQWINDYRDRFKVAELEGLPRFIGGLVGYFGYDTIRYVEPKLGQCLNPDEFGTADIMLMLATEILVFDNLKGSVYIVVLAPTQEAGYTNAKARIDELAITLQNNVSSSTLLVHEDDVKELDFVSGFSEQGFKEAVVNAKQYIVAGDVMQVVLSQRLNAEFNGSAIDVYRHLRRLNPSPYMYYLNMGDFEIVGSSPEILVRQEGKEVTVRPIAGTRPRGQDAKQDQELEEELLADPKELAEHLMLIDLGRNDIGRIAEVGSVELTDKMIVERYSHVMHIVSNVRGTLAPDQSCIDVLRATFPAGTVSGAPKIRAMEIIDELEPVKRGVYSGAIGYISWNGDMDTAIAIRTAVIKDNIISVQAGAGIVYDSQPDNEWIETLNKAKAVLRAAAMAEKAGSE
ncbi:MAG: anthranilate synthase component I [Gammaproteobacteria bacterium]